MNITTFSDYTLRVLIYLAVHTSNAHAKASAQTIAASYGISFHHIAKAAQWLAREGYVHAERGRSGGLRLAREPALINIGEVLQRAEQGSALVNCMKSDGGTCAITPACGLKHALAEAQGAFYKTLSGYTLADIAAQKSNLVNLLA